MQRPSPSTKRYSKSKITVYNPPPGSVQCRICNRFFHQDRIAKHQHVCRTSLKERSVFDASRHRLKGTEAEKYYKPTPIRGSATSIWPIPAKKTSNWRKNHEQFIAAIRAAKEVHTHLARGGKLSELPPFIPSENPDYVQCPHCLRKFNETVANRHIPKCAEMIHNKLWTQARKK